MNIQDNAGMQGRIKLEQWNGKEWKFICEKQNTVNVGLKYAIATMIASNTGKMATKMSAGTVATSFTENSVALGNEVGSSTNLVNTSALKVATCVSTILFAGNYTIKEVGLWNGTTPLAFTNTPATAVTSLSPIRISWSITVN